MGKDSDFDYYGTELTRTFRLKDGQLKYLVVGTGRCGTVFMARLLSSIGIPCTHEGIFYRDGLVPALARMKGELPIEISDIAKMASQDDEGNGVKWFQDEDGVIEAESSYMAAPFLDHPSLENTAIIHVVREPMAVINSFVEGFQYFRPESFNEEYVRNYHRFIYGHLPVLKEKMDTVSRAALYYVEWNEMIERLAKGRRYYLHLLNRPLDRLFKFVGVQPTNFYNNVTNHREDLAQVYTRYEDIPDIPARARARLLWAKYMVSLQ